MTLCHSRCFVLLQYPVLLYEYKKCDEILMKFWPSVYHRFVIITSAMTAGRTKWREQGGKQCVRLRLTAWDNMRLLLRRAYCLCDLRACGAPTCSTYSIIGQSLWWAEQPCVCVCIQVWWCCFWCFISQTTGRKKCPVKLHQSRILTELIETYCYNEDHLNSERKTPLQS